MTLNKPPVAPMPEFIWLEKRLDEIIDHINACRDYSLSQDDWCEQVALIVIRLKELKDKK